jgi:peroxiredoxin
MARLNWRLWTGLLIAVLSVLSFPFLFIKWPVTRDVPWVNVLMALGALALLTQGVRRAFRPDRRLFSRIVAVVVAGLGLFVLWTFVTALFIAPRQLPASAHAPDVGQKAPGFMLADANNQPVTLDALLSSPIRGKAPRGVLLIFEMGHGCHACSSELHGMQAHLGELYDAGIRPVAISTDSPEVSRQTVEAGGFTFPFLSDSRSDAIRRFDVADADSGDAARPAEFLVDASGIVRWRMLTSNYYVRARPDEILKAAQTLH